MNPRSTFRSTRAVGASRESSAAPSSAVCWTARSESKNSATAVSVTREGMRFARAATHSSADTEASLPSKHQEHVFHEDLLMR